MKILMIIALFTPVLSVQASTISREFLHFEQRRDRTAQEEQLRASERDARDRHAVTPVSEIYREPASGAGCGN